MNTVTSSLGGCVVPFASETLGSRRRMWNTQSSPPWGTRKISVSPTAGPFRATAAACALTIVGGVQLGFIWKPPIPYNMHAF